MLKCHYHKTSWQILLIFFASLLLFSIGLYHQEFTQFEVRFGLFAKDMFRNGLSLFPTEYGKPYPDYPGTSTILITLLSHLFGKVTLFSANLPTAIAASITTVFTYLIGAQHSKRWGFYAVLLLLLTNEFFATARQIGMDHFITMVTTICFYLVYRKNSQPPNKQLIFIGLFLLFGFAIRGPIGLVIPAAVLTSYFLVQQEYKRMWVMILLSGVLFSISMLALLLAAYHVGGQAFLKRVIVMQITGRVGQNDSMSHLYYFYSSFSAFALSFPLAFLFIAGNLKHHFKKTTSPEQKTLLALTVWVVVILLGMSLTGSEKPRYILAIAPATSLLAAYIFIDKSTTIYTTILKRTSITFLYSLPFILLAISLIGLLYSHNYHLDFNIYFPLLISALCIICTLEIASIFKNHKLNPCVGLMMTLIAYLCVYLLAVEPVIVKTTQSKAFVTQVEKLQTAQQQIIFYGISEDSIDVNFMVNASKPFRPVFYYSPKQLLKNHSNIIFVTRKKAFDELPLEIRSHYNILASGQLGRTKTLAFTREQQTPEK